MKRLKLDKIVSLQGVFSILFKWDKDKALRELEESEEKENQITKNFEESIKRLSCLL